MSQRPRAEIEGEFNGCHIDEEPGLILEVLLDIRELLSVVRGERNRPAPYVTVRHYRRPDVGGDEICFLCHRRMDLHGWIDTIQVGGEGINVCPGEAFNP